MRSSVLALFAGLATVAVASFNPDDHSLEELIARGVVIEERGHSDGDWHDLDVGLMMERSAVPASSLAAGVQERDLAPVRQSVVLERDASGGLVLPRSAEEAEEMSKRAEDAVAGHANGAAMVKRSTKAKRATTIVTWYNGQDLKNPACQNRSRWNPRDNSFIFAVSAKWKGAPGCGKCLKITAKDGRHSIIVREWDHCAGCTAEAWCDLPRGPFSVLGKISQGKLKGLKYKKVACPKGRQDIYGPDYM